MRSYLRMILVPDNRGAFRTVTGYGPVSHTRDSREVEVYRIDVEFRAACIWSGGHGEKTMLSILQSQTCADVECHESRAGTGRDRVYKFETDQPHGIAMMVIGWQAACASLDYTTYSVIFSLLHHSTSKAILMLIIVRHPLSRSSVGRISLLLSVAGANEANADKSVCSSLVCLNSKINPHSLC